MICVLAATKVQARYRGILGRRRARDKAIRRAEERRIQGIFATKIQARVRGLLGRKRARERRAELEALRKLQKKSAITIQSQYRGRLGRIKFKKRLEEFKKRNRSCNFRTTVLEGLSDSWLETHSI